MKKNRPEWTDEQKEIIHARNAELLVSAAAGSGKTAVLVERIFDRIMDKKDPVDIDRFVVVTFTKAAAAEMKDRLLERIEDAIMDESTAPEQKERLRQQARLIPGAHISTVHSFCSFIIGQYFYRIGLDPAVSEAEQSELILLKNEVLEALLEREYEEEKEDFEKLASLRSLNKNDAMLKSWILEMYENAFCEPFPDLTMSEWENRIQTPVDQEDSFIISELIRHVTCRAEEIAETTEEIWNRNTASFTGKSDAKTPAEMIGVARSLVSIGESFEKGERTAEKAYEDMRLTLEGMELKGLPKSPTGKEGAEDRDRVIEALAPLRERLEVKFRDTFFTNTLKEHEAEREAMADTTLAIIRLTRAFAKDYAAAKKERGIIDFNDLEQFALQILFDREEATGRPIRSDVAKELSDYFSEIMIDEYQDSNRVQDTILWSIAKSDGSEKDGKPPWECTAKNRFMVGDIKQSIYRFRHACPELFRHKLETFSQDKDAACRRIDLHMNFRSRQIVIDATNEVFDRVMKKDIGGVDYDQDARLVCGLSQPEPEKDQVTATMVYEDKLTYDTADKTWPRDRVEARHIACRIRDLVEGDDPLYIADKSGTYRRVRYRDIVILSRALMPIAYTYAEEMKELHVPFVTELTQGFFDTREISLMVQLLQIIDNPRQDIPLAGVLVSPLFGMDETMLSEIRIAFPTGELYDTLQSFLNDDEKNESDPIRERLSAFFSLLEELRAEAPFVPMSNLLEDVFRKTGVYEMFSWDEDSERRLANLDYLMTMVTEYDKGSRQGVHAFVEYLSQIRENKVDAGEAMTISENEDVVRLMSIHKSKGLEFPVVFIARAGALPNESDVGRFVYDEGLGVGGYMDDAKEGWTKKTLLWNMIRGKNTEDERGESFRLLYVAMTRARDQLILVHADKGDVKDRRTDYEGRMRMTTLMDMIRPAITADEDDLFCLREITGSVESFWKVKIGEWRASEVTSSEDINIFDTSDPYNTGIQEESVNDMEEVVPPIRMSVSELKLASMDEQGEQTGTRLEASDEEEDGGSADAGYASSEGKPTVDEDELPAFMKGKGHRYSGAERGTIYHQVMATIDFAGLAELLSADVNGTDESEVMSKVGQALDRVVEDKHLRPEERRIVDVKKLVTFFLSELGQRMIRAAGVGKLKREQPFVINKKASEIDPEKYGENNDTPVMIQGIIDGYFEEEDGIVLMDYKTDYMGESGPEVLAERYHVQMELYREALERLPDGKKVKECYLYSFHMGRMVPVTFN